jgi:diguanylate cyclase (GGDEF)-like protein
MTPVRPRTSPPPASTIQPEDRQDPPAEPVVGTHPPRRTPHPRQPWSPTSEAADNEAADNQAGHNPAGDNEAGGNQPGDREAADPAVAMELALEHALSISTATTEDDLITRTVEAAGRLTAATVACTVPDAGTPHTWGDPAVAQRLVDAVAAGRVGRGRSYDPAEPQRVEFRHLDLPDGLYALVGGAPLVVASAQPDRFGPPAQRLFGLVVAHAEAGWERLRELALLARRADSDPLTGIRRYRPFEERLAASVPGRTAIIAIDVDNFKQINDSHGHQAGDAALVALVGALSRALRGDDHIYRIGGDEFAVVIDVATAAEVTAISRRLLRAARRAGYPISIGAALHSPQETGRETLLRADQALYQAKLAGRNTVRLAA